MRDSQLYNVHTIHNQYEYNLTEIRDHITYSYRVTDLAKAFHTDCLKHLIERYALFMLYLSHKLTYSEYTANIKVLNTVLLCTIALR